MSNGISQAAIDGHLETLVETPGRLAHHAADLDEARLSDSRHPDSWSAVELLAHLRACAEVWSGSVYMMLALDHPSLPRIHPREWQAVRGYAEAGFHRSLEAFRLQREEFVRVLNGLPLDAWARSCTIDSRTHTVFSQVRRMALHEAGHWQQIEALFDGDRAPP